MSKKVSNIEKLNQSKEKLEETLRSRLGRVIVVRFICLGNHLKSIAVHELWSKKVSNIEKLDQSKEKLEKKTLRSRLGGVVVWGSAGWESWSRNLPW